MLNRATPLTWTLIASLAALSACGSASDNTPIGADPTPSHSATPSETSEVAGGRISLRTHCGILGVTVAGRVWLAHPSVGDDSGNPPAGWGENETLGSFVQTNATSATFTADNGRTATFRLAKAGTADPNQGCE